MADLNFNDPQPKYFIRELERLSDGSKSPREMFRDFCEMGYCAYAKVVALSHLDNERAEELEARYMRIVGTYRNKDTVRGYPQLLAYAQVGVEAGQDFLGVVSAEMETLDARSGQFFTPMAVCQMMAQMTLGDEQALTNFIEARGGYLRFGEPASGAGAIILAVADHFRKNGHDPMTSLLVYAADISPLAFHMCYLQMTWAGVPGFVAQENSLSLERFDGAWTIPTTIFRMHHATLFNKKPKQAQNDSAISEEQHNEDAPKPIPVPKYHLKPDNSQCSIWAVTHEYRTTLPNPIRHYQLRGIT